MSYMVLARKWRPMKFDEVVAQGHVTTTLKNAIANDRLASAYLFSGPRGVGKTTTARIFAKAINCEHGPTPTPCNECTSCKEITGGRSLDVFEIDGASNRGIDEVRNLRENLRYAASKGKYKIYIIDEVHMLTTEAFNALLKTLEEPPAKVLFIFATTEPQKVPATILSRCQRYDFRRIPLKDIVEKLKQICAAEAIRIDDESLYLIAKKSEGSLRDSQSLLDQVVSFSGQEIKAEDLTELLGIIDHDFYFECSDIMNDKDVAGALNFAEKLFSCGYDSSEFLSGLAEHYRNMLVIKSTNNLELLEGLETYAQRYLAASETLSETDLLRLIQISADAAFQIKRSENPKLILEMLLVKMSKMDKSVELQTLLSNLDNLQGVPVSTQTQPKPKPLRENSSQSKAESRLTQLKQLNQRLKVSDENPEMNKDADQPVATTTEPVETEVVSLEKIKEVWPVVVDAVKARKIHLGSFLNEGHPTAYHNGVLEISFAKANGFHVNTINQQRELIQNIILEQTRFKVKIKCRKDESLEFEKLISDNKPEEIKAIEPEEEVEEETDMLNVPIVKKVLEVFDGEIIREKRTI